MQLLSRLRAYKFLLVLLGLVALRITFLGTGNTDTLVKSNYLEALRLDIYNYYLTLFPSPHSELLSGMVLGLDKLNLVPTFNDILVKTGTIHVVVVSGFNIVLFFDFLTRLLGTIYKLKNFLIAEIVSLIYAVFAGFEYPVVRAWIMCTVLYTAKFLGIRTSAFYILALTCCTIVLVQPLAITDMSFQLSFLAVMGLMLFGSYFEKVFKTLLNRKNMPFYFKDFVSSLSAQVLVWPLISYKIGTVNLFSTLSNAFLLWSVSYSTTLGLFMSVFYKITIVGSLMRFLIYPYLDFFVEGSYFFSSIFPDQLQYKLNLQTLLIYYFFVSLFVYRKKLFR